jgi:hypothetical protein
MNLTALNDLPSLLFMLMIWKLILLPGLLQNLKPQPALTLKLKFCAEMLSNQIPELVNVTA